MKWLWAFIALVLAQLSNARGLKAPRAPDANVALSKQLEAENEALRKQNQQLESMMQVARAEVHRMDAAAAAKKRGHGSSSDAEVLKQEIQDLKQQLERSDSEKADLVQTLRKMLTKNSTQVFQRQAERAEHMKTVLELRCGEERKALEGQVKEANDQVKEANGKCDEIKEAARQMQDSNAQLQKKLEDAQAGCDKVSEANRELSTDKSNLVATMQGLMRDNSRFKYGLEKESDLERKEAKELDAERAKFKAPKQAKKLKKQATKTSGALLPHHKGSRGELAKMKAESAHMRAMDKYIDTAEADGDSDDAVVTKRQLNAMQRQDDLFRKGKVGTHLSDWLGMKVEKPKAASKSASPVKKEAAKAVLNDGGESEAEGLLEEAKADLQSLDDKVPVS